VKTLHRGDDLHDELFVAKASFGLALVGEYPKKAPKKSGTSMMCRFFDFRTYFIEVVVICTNAVLSLNDRPWKSFKPMSDV
jgi:hypothetical protein